MLSLVIFSVLLTGGFSLRGLLADESLDQKELVLLERLEEKIETRLDTMENVKRRQDNTMMAADEIELISDKFPEMSNDTIEKLRLIALNYVDPISDVMNSADAEKKRIEKGTEERLQFVEMSDSEQRRRISVSSIEMVAKIFFKQQEDVQALNKKKEAQMLEAVPAELKGKFQSFLNPDQYQAETQSEINSGQ